MRRKIRKKGELKRTRERKEKELEVQGDDFCTLQYQEHSFMFSTTSSQSSKLLRKLYNFLTLVGLEIIMHNIKHFLFIHNQRVKLSMTKKINHELSLLLKFPWRFISHNYSIFNFSYSILKFGKMFHSSFTWRISWMLM